MNTAIKQGLCPEKFWTKDVDGNILKTYRIGDYLITDNLKVEHYNDGTSIPLITDNKAWASTKTGAMCYYNNDLSNKEQYGGLYNFYAVETGKLAPEGWHVPSDDEWKVLEMKLGMTQSQADGTGWRGTDQGRQLKSTDLWTSHANSGINSSGLDMRMGGYRYSSGGSFSNLGTNGYWWSSTPIDSSSAWRRGLYYSEARVSRNAPSKSGGYSVRCVRKLTEGEKKSLDNNLTSNEIKISGISDMELIDELKRRGYAGELNKTTKIIL